MSGEPEQSSKIVISLFRQPAKPEALKPTVISLPMTTFVQSTHQSADDDLQNDLQPASVQDVEMQESLQLEQKDTIKILNTDREPAIISIPILTASPATSPVKLRIPLSAQANIVPAPLSQIPKASQPILLPQSPFQVQMNPVPLTQSVPNQAQRPKKLLVSLAQVYKPTHRSLAMKLDPTALNFQAQLIYTFELYPKTQIEEWLQSLIDQECGKVAIDMKFIAKQIQVQNIWELNGTERIKRFVFNEEQQAPTVQAQTQQQRFQGQKLKAVSDIQYLEKTYQSSELINGTIQLKRKVIGLRPKKQSVAEMFAKFKPEIKIMLEFTCDQITEGSTVRYVKYQDSNGQNSCQKYIYTAEQKPECWLPLMVGLDQVATPWQLKYVVPAEYMVVSSGLQTSRQHDANNSALHIYEVENLCADRIGFICLKFPKITTIEPTKSAKGAFACFLSTQKQQSFNQSFVVEVMEYLQNLLGVSEYPCKQTRFMFVPNLMPLKFPKQSISFGEGLHLLDEQLLVRQNQIDKRHHFYKQLAGAVTFDFFGSRVREAKPSDLWLMVAIRERIGDRMKKKKCGMLLYKYQVMRNIERMYKQMKYGAEIRPLQSAIESAYHLSGEQQLSDLFYRKCSLLMHMIESSIDEATLDKILKGLYADAMDQEQMLSQFMFRKKFKKICGMHPIHYYKNWIWATSCPELELSYEFNKRNNSLDITLKQTSAVQHGQTEHQNLGQKVDRIFSAQKPASELTIPLDALYIDVQQAARRWFTGNINIVIYQIEGNGGDIIPQQHKMSLKEFKSVTTSHIPLQGKVKRTMNNRKKEEQVLTIEQKMQSDFGSFKMNEFELEDYPQETKSIFQDLDNSNPVLWIRVDPDMEYIRKVRVQQDKRNNWLWQLLREQDIIGQIEAVRRLPAYNEELVYEILKTVAGSETFFFKIRKEVLKALRKMEVYTFNKFISHESFLLKMFNTRRMLPGDSANIFYKENDFSNVLEYYMERALLKAISNCKEDSLPLTSEKQKEVQEKMQQRQRQVALQNGLLQDNEVSIEPTNTNAICLPIIDSKIVRQKKAKQRFDETQYKCTTETVAKMLMRVLEQNDNSENDVDDSYYLKDLIASLGRVDSIAMMPAIATEIFRQFKLDQISNSSPQFAITVGAIKAYFNMTKQIFKFRTEKEPNLEPTHPKVQNYAAQLEQATHSLKQLKVEIDAIMMNQFKPLQVRLFIFNEEVKSLLKFKNLGFAEAFLTILKTIDTLQGRGQLMLAFYGLRDLVLYLELKKNTGTLQVIDVYQRQFRHEIKQRLWDLYRLPHAYLSHEFSYWTKRLIQRLFANQVPDCECLEPVDYDSLWTQTEQDLVLQQNLLAEKVPTFVNPQYSQTQVKIKTTPNANDRAGRIIRAAGGPIKIQIGMAPANNEEDEAMVSDGSQGQAEPVDDDESIIDPFADIKFDDLVMQKCWDVLGKLYYHYESTDFLEPITVERFGQQFYDDYFSIVENPMDISTIMERMKADYYLGESRGDRNMAKELFRRDVNLIFQNCKDFNERNSDIVKSATRLTLEFKKLWVEHGLIHSY